MQYLELMVVSQSTVSKFLANECLDKLKIAVDSEDLPDLEAVHFHLKRLIGVDDG